MMRKGVNKSVQNKYKDAIMERLGGESTGGKKYGTQIQNLRTQCTPNDKTMDICERACEEFQQYFKLKYKPVVLPGKVRPVARCLYPELMDLARNSSLKSQNSFAKYKKTRAHTEAVSAQKQQRSNHKKVSTQFLKKQQKQTQIEKSKKKSTQRKPSQVHNESESFQRQNSLASLKPQKSSTMKRTQSIKQFNNAPKAKRSETLGNESGFKGYSVKNLKALVKRNQGKNG